MRNPDRDLYFAMALLYHLLINFQKIINYMKFYQLTPMKIDKFQTIYEIIDILFNSFYFRNIPFIPETRDAET